VLLGGVEIRVVANLRGDVSGDVLDVVEGSLAHLVVALKLSVVGELVDDGGTSGLPDVRSERHVLVEPWLLEATSGLNGEKRLDNA